MLKQFMTTTALIAVLAVPAMAQETQDQPAAPAPLGAPDVQTPALPPLVAVELSEVTADQLIGSSVINPAEETLGSIDDAIFDADGKLESVVVSFGGFLGFGTKTVLLPIDQVTVKSRGDGAYTVETDMTPDELAAMPEYQKG